MKPEIIEEMYAQTLSLFEQHKTMFASVRLIDVSNGTLIEPTQSDPFLPDWITRNGLQSYLPT